MIIFSCQHILAEFVRVYSTVIMLTLKDRIKKLAEAKGIGGIPKLESELGFGNGTIVKWDKSSPSADKLNKVADYFGVSVDYLLGRSETEDDDIMEVRERLRRQPGMRLLFDAADGATAEQLEAVAEMIKAWKES